MGLQSIVPGSEHPVPYQARAAILRKHLFFHWRESAQRVKGDSRNVMGLLHHLKKGGRPGGNVSDCERDTVEDTQREGDGGR
jgi:hypothetical protein